jgi:hypothetical protein
MNSCELLKVLHSYE